MTDGRASQNCNEANDNINSNLELQEFPAVVVEGSAPFDRSVNGVEIVIQNNKIRVVFGNVTTSSHAQTDIGLFECLGIGDAVSGHSNEATSIFDALNEDEFLLRSASSDNFDFLLQLVEFLNTIEFNCKLASLWVPHFSVASKFSEEFLSGTKGAWLLSLLLRDNSGLNGNMSSSFWMITSQNSNCDFGLVRASIDFIRIPSKLESPNISFDTVSNGILHAESTQICQV